MLRLLVSGWQLENRLFQHFSFAGSVHHGLRRRILYSSFSRLRRSRSSAFRFSFLIFFAIASADPVQFAARPYTPPNSKTLRKYGSDESNLHTTRPGDKRDICFAFSTEYRSSRGPRPRSSRSRSSSCSAPSAPYADGPNSFRSLPVKNQPGRGCGNSTASTACRSRD